jgi:hypothetical protein
MSSIEKEIRNPRGRIFRRLYIKRRLATTGLFETNWMEITDDVKNGVRFPNRLTPFNTVKSGSQSLIS